MLGKVPMIREREAGLTGLQDSANLLGTLRKKRIQYSELPSHL